LGSEDLQNLRIGALLHDLGKIGIMSNVLKKEQRLTDTSMTA
jgi:HD-GYP domain-containing protein (c-di-GMP phosphodiesterase class II)